MKQPSLDFTPIGVFEFPPPDNTGGSIGAVQIARPGHPEDVTVAGVALGPMLVRATRYEGWIKRHLAHLVP